MRYANTTPPRARGLTLSSSVTVSVSSKTSGEDTSPVPCSLRAYPASTMSSTSPSANSLTASGTPATVRLA